MCGEKDAFYPVMLSGSGSPPRMRGKECRQYMAHLSPRITPAYAGKRASARHRQGSGGDHPRVCGEKLKSLLPTTRCLGSPPRMRGKVHLARLPIRRGRITPAYAGKRTAYQNILADGRDHPRVCGEKYCGHCYFLPPYGITPAYAGKSSLACCPWRLHRDHPRVCGEKHNI